MLHFAEASAMDYMYEQGKRLTLAWNANDKVGITTGIANYGMMEQLTFWVSSKIMSAPNERSLYAVGYSLKENTHYYSYFPYSWQNAFDAHNIPCTYEGQKQMANADASHLSAFDYQMADATPAAGACIFSYQHIGGVLRVSFSAPAAMTICSLNINAKTEALVNATEMNIIEKNVTHIGHTKTIRLATDNFCVLPGEKVVCYLAVAVQDLSGEVLNITITDSSGREQTIATIKGPDIKAGRMYDMALTQMQNAAKYDNAAAKLRQRPVVTASGVANPVARTTDILVDESYTVQHVEQPDVPTALENVTIENNGVYFTLSGLRGGNVSRDKICIYKGKKIIRK